MFSATLSVIATAAHEVETLSVKLAGTMALFQIISVVPRHGEKVRRALLRASHAAHRLNREIYHRSKPKDPPQAVKKPRKLVPMMKFHLRGQA
jgi:hypothetical protein